MTGLPLPQANVTKTPSLGLPFSGLHPQDQCREQSLGWGTGKDLLQRGEGQLPSAKGKAATLLSVK